MSYTYDIFISYKRHRLAKKWIEEQFKELLEFYVDHALGRTPAIFVDDQIDVGADWPSVLANNIQCSRVLVPLWSRNYFTSEWCCRELARMMARERGERVPGKDQRLVAPVIVNNYEQPAKELPEPVRAIQAEPIHDYFNPYMQKEGKLAEGLAQVIAQRLAPGVTKSIEAAPDWKETWELRDEEVLFKALYNGDAPVQVHVPGWSS
ncbi:TIR domain-containing protein [Candidatus Entotheonella palauensis]|uniref:TIR domain-containing protein n=1 Tax=Candidatus Entotheonella gemina TaxID=1429439 RepID=W4LX51_9BACT|nr:TIR domain-containing protein [Candidatus Entotheonella palauensis]ETX02500.1 MAG: hypothetical protein ETSY2_35460 [Candidatus Entotheonella gemina]